MKKILISITMIVCLCFSSCDRIRHLLNKHIIHKNTRIEKVEEIDAEELPDDFNINEKVSSREEWRDVVFEGYTQFNSKKFPIKITALGKNINGEWIYKDGHYYNINYNVDFPVVISDTYNGIEINKDPFSDEFRIIAYSTDPNIYEGEMINDKEGMSLYLFLESN